MTFEPNTSVRRAVSSGVPRIPEQVCQHQKLLYFNSDVSDDDDDDTKLLLLTTSTNNNKYCKRYMHNNAILETPLPPVAKYCAIL